MIKVSKLADYAVVVLASLAGAELGKVMSASDLSEQTKLPEPTVSKVLKLLAKGEILNSVRGASGGYTFMKPPESITVADIIMAVDGPISLTACVEGSEQDCTYAACCSIKGRWTGVNKAIKDALDNISLSDMAGMGGIHKKSNTRDVA